MSKKIKCASCGRKVRLKNHRCPKCGYEFVQSGYYNYGSMENRAIDHTREINKVNRRRYTILLLADLTAICTIVVNPVIALIFFLFLFLMIGLQRTFDQRQKRMLLAVNTIAFLTSAALLVLERVS